MANGNNNAHSAIDNLLALEELRKMMKNNKWQGLQDSLLGAAQGYNPPAYGQYSGQDLGSNPLGGAVADMMYQSLSGKDYTQYDQARTMGGTRQQPAPSNIMDIIKLIQSMQK